MTATKPRIPTIGLAILVLALCLTTRADAVTYYGEAREILRGHCTTCHRSGGPAPFSLETYEQARAWSRAIVRETRAGRMPPWLPREGGPFRGQRRLNREAADLLAKWAAAGSPQGTADPRPRMPSAPAVGFGLGRPDLVLESPAYRVPERGPDLFRNFVFPIPHPPPSRSETGASLRWVTAVEIDPGNAQILHHAVLSVDPTSASRHLDEADPEPGFSGMELTPLESPGGFFVGWTPGRQPFPGYPGTGFLLEPGTNLVLQTHLVPAAEPQSLRPRIGLHMAGEPPRLRLHVLRLGSSRIEIPEGAAGYTIADRLTLPVDVELLSLYPHAHLLARTMIADALFPDGSRQRLLGIPRWDFRWQEQYRLVEPLPLPAGSEIEMYFTYDNSTANPDAPYPPRAVLFGPTTADEMGDLWLEVRPRDPRDFQHLRSFSEKRRIERRLAGARWKVALASLAESERFEARFELTAALNAAGQLDRARLLLEELLGTRPDSSRLHTNLGNLHLSTGRGDLALPHLQRAAELDPQSPEAAFNLANALAAQGRAKAALAHFRRVIELDPEHVRAHLNRGVLLNRLGRYDDEIIAYRAALTARPTYAAAHYNLGRALLRDERGAEAVTALETALLIAPEIEEVRGALADALLELGRFVDAAGHYRQLVAQEPKLHEARYRLAWCYERSGRQEQAVAELRKLLELAPGHERAKRLLGEIADRP